MIILLGRSKANIQPTIEAVDKISPSTTTKFLELHLDSFESVRRAAKQILEDDTIPQVDVLINNAGIMACPWALSKDGIETQFATNHVGHFLLTNLVMPKLRAASPPARVVNVSSWGNVLSDVLEDPNFGGDVNKYRPLVAYGLSKCANVLFAVALNSRLKDMRIKAFAADPGSEYQPTAPPWKSDSQGAGVPTNLRRYITPDMMADGELTTDVALTVLTELAVDFIAAKTTMPPRKTLQQGCATIVLAAVDPDLSGT
jgi:NAD(P)-dependent dehydrogenase (short-subunit alcohol dehydrogenase family)